MHLPPLQPHPSMEMEQLSMPGEEGGFGSVLEVPYILQPVLIFSFVAAECVPITQITFHCSAVHFIGIVI